MIILKNGVESSSPKVVALTLTQEDTRKLPFIVTSKNIIVTLTRTKRPKRLFVQRFDAFATDLLSLLDDLESGEVARVSFRNELLGDFVIVKDSTGNLQCAFEPRNKAALVELQTRLAKRRC